MKALPSCHLYDTIYNCDYANAKDEPRQVKGLACIQCKIENDSQDRKYYAYNDEGHYILFARDCLFSLHTHLPHFLLLYICVSRDETNRYMADSEIQNRAMPAAGFFT